MEEICNLLRTYLKLRKAEVLGRKDWVEGWGETRSHLSEKKYNPLERHWCMIHHHNKAAIEFCTVYQVKEALQICGTDLSFTTSKTCDSYQESTTLIGW